MKRAPASINPPCSLRIPQDRHFPLTHDEEVIVARVITQFERIRRGHANWYTAQRIAAAAQRIRKA